MTAAGADAVATAYRSAGASEQEDQVMLTRHLDPQLFGVNRLGVANECTI